jgi:hypothetical protein
MSFPPRMLPGDPDDNDPEAPPGTIFVVGPEQGYAVAPDRYFELFFGRDSEEVHVPIGADDPTVSRRHGVFTCYGPGSGWWLRNNGNLPIELPDRDLLLTGHERVLAPGYTPLVINPSGQRPHLVKVRITGGSGPHPQRAREPDAAPLEQRETDEPQTAYELSEPERLVLTAQARLYLENDDHPRPLTWKETARVANGSPHRDHFWTDKMAEHTVEDVRMRLHRLGVGRLTRKEVGEPVGTKLSENLIRVLIRTWTLRPKDLALLAEDD